MAIVGTEDSLQTSALRATSRDTEGGNAPRPTSSPSSSVIYDKYINHSNVESNNNEHVSLKGCCFDAYEFEMDQNSGNVKGRLHDHLSFWKDIQANGFVLDVIKMVILYHLLNQRIKCFAEIINLHYKMLILFLRQFQIS